MNNSTRSNSQSSTLPSTEGSSLQYTEGSSSSNSNDSLISEESPSRTKKNRKDGQNLIHVFLEIITAVKFYHWSTTSYSEHKATDELYERLDKNIDRFVEVYLGKDQSRIKGIKQTMNFEFKNRSNFVKKLKSFRTYLGKMENWLNKDSDSDLFSIRDEILADVNQFMYLLTLK